MQILTIISQIYQLIKIVGLKNANKEMCEKFKLNKFKYVNVHVLYCILL